MTNTPTPEQLAAKWKRRALALREDYTELLNAATGALEYLESDPTLSLVSSPLRAAVNAVAPSPQAQQAVCVVCGHHEVDDEGVCVVNVSAPERIIRCGHRCEFSQEGVATLDYDYTRGMQASCPHIRIECFDCGAEVNQDSVNTPDRVAQSDNRQDIQASDADGPYPLVNQIEIQVCQPCIELKGEECHTPECRFFLRGMNEVKHFLDVLLICPIVDGERLILHGATVDAPPESTPDLTPPGPASEPNSCSESVTCPCGRKIQPTKKGNPMTKDNEAPEQLKLCPFCGVGREKAIHYLVSICAEVTEDRVLLAQFLATKPTATQIQLATSIAIERAERLATVSEWQPMRYALQAFVDYYTQAGIGSCMEGRDDEDGPFSADERFNVRQARRALSHTDTR